MVAAARDRTDRRAGRISPSSEKDSSHDCDENQAFRPSDRLALLDLDRGAASTALLAFVPAYFSWPRSGVCLVLHWLTGGLGICLTYHRLLTHRSFAIRPRWLEYILTVIGCCASEGGAVGWVADHRKHHAHSDDEHDVHSPNRGFRWAHMLWWMTPDVAIRSHNREYYKKWAPDLYRDPVHRLLDRYPHRLPILMFAGLYALGGMPWLVWGGFVRYDRGLAHDLAGQLGHPPLGLSHPQDPRHLDEPLVGRSADLSARAGTTTTTPSRLRRVTACGGGKST